MVAFQRSCDAVTISPPLSDESRFRRPLLAGEGTGAAGPPPADGAALGSADAAGGVAGDSGGLAMAPGALSRLPMRYPAPAKMISAATPAIAQPRPSPRPGGRWVCTEIGGGACF